MFSGYIFDIFGVFDIFDILTDRSNNNFDRFNSHIKNLGWALSLFLLSLSPKLEVILCF